MAHVFAHLTIPVTAKVVNSFGSFRKDEQVIINRVTENVSMVGIAGRTLFLPFAGVDQSAQEEIRRQVRELTPGIVNS